MFSTLKVLVYELINFSLNSVGDWTAETWRSISIEWRHLVGGVSTFQLITRLKCSNRTKFGSSCTFAHCSIIHTNSNIEQAMPVTFDIFVTFHRQRPSSCRPASSSTRRCLWRRRAVPGVTQWRPPSAGVTASPRYWGGVRERVSEE